MIKKLLARFRRKQKEPTLLTEYINHFNNSHSWRSYQINNKRS